MNLSNYGRLYIPLNSSVAFPIGTQIDFIQTGVPFGFMGVSGVTMYSKNNAQVSNGQGSAQTLIKVGTDTWWLIGDIA